MTAYRISPIQQRSDTTARLFVEEMGQEHIERNCLDGDLVLATIMAEQWPATDVRELGIGSLNPTIQN